MISKEEARALMAPEGARPRAKGAPGKIAEQVRRLAGYRGAARVFVTPSPLLQQVRINVLTDGKELLMPGPRLREGFYLLKPYVIPFASLTTAVCYKGLAQHGHRLTEEELGAVPVGLLLMDPVAVDPAGGFVGDGKGFFDLSAAILQELHALAPDATAYGAGEAAQLLAQPLARAAWDVRLAGLVTPQGLLPCSGGDLGSGRIFWQELSPARIRKVTPLWKLSHRREVAVDQEEKSG